MLGHDPKRVIQDAQYALPYHHIPPGWRWDYAEEYEAYLKVVVEWVRALAPTTLLDVGCGDGRLLKELGFGSGCDLSHDAIRWAQALGLNAFEVDAADIPGRFELVTAIEVLEHVPDDGVARFAKILAARSARHVLVCVPTDAVPVSEKHYRHYNEETLRAHLSPVLDELWCKRIVEGKHLLSLWMVR